MFAQIFANFQFNFQKTLKNWTFSIKIIKKCTFFIDFSKIFENFFGVRGLRPRTPYAAAPLQALPYWTSLPPEKFLQALMNCNNFRYPIDPHPRYPLIFGWSHVHFKIVIIFPRFLFLTLTMRTFIILLFEMIYK